MYYLSGRWEHYCLSTILSIFTWRDDESLLLPAQTVCYFLTRVDLPIHVKQKNVGRTQLISHGWVPPRLPRTREQRFSFGNTIHTQSITQPPAIQPASAGCKLRRNTSLINGVAWFLIKNLMCPTFQTNRSKSDSLGRVLFLFADFIPCNNQYLQSFYCTFDMLTNH